MKKSITQIYQDAIDKELKPKEVSPEEKPQETINRFEIWSQDSTSDIIIQELKKRRENLLKQCMECCDDSVNMHYVLSHLREARTLTQTINLMQTGAFK